MSRQLIVEHITPMKVRTAESIDGVLWFEAVVSEAGHLNRNRRVYPDYTIFPAFERYNDELAAGLGQPGLVDHPNIFSGTSVSSIGVAWEKFWFEDKLIIGRGRVVPTSKGRDLEAAMQAGIPVGFSTRGYGDKEEFNADDGKPAWRMLPGFELETVDAVVDPSVYHARVRKFSKEDLDRMEEQLKELEAKLAAAEALVAELQGKLSEAETARDAAVSAPEAASGEHEAALGELQGRLDAAEARVAELEKFEVESALTAKLSELTEGHPFAATIVNEARELGVTVESAEKVVARLKSLVEAAAAAANSVEATPRGDLSTEEDVEPAKTDDKPKYSKEQLDELLSAGLMTEGKYQAALALLA
jgi:Prohead core protein serine protease